MCSSICIGFRQRALSHFLPACQCVRKRPLRDSNLRHRTRKLRGLLLNYRGLQAGSREKKNTPPANVHAVFFFQTVKFCNFAHVFYVRLRRPHLSFFYLYGYLIFRQFRFLEKCGPPRTRIIRRKKYNKEKSPEVRSWDGHVEHVSKNSGSISTTAWTCGLL